jgi:hypothetical protein
MVSGFCAEDLKIGLQLNRQRNKSMKNQSQKTKNLLINQEVIADRV